MAKAAIVEAAHAHDFPFKKTELVVKMKRKTPSQLREEQLKRRGNQKGGEKESQPFKVPKYVNTRVSEVYPVKKSSGLQSLKEKTKDSKIENEKANNNSSSTLPCMNEELNAKEIIFKKTEQCSQSQLRNVIQLHKKDEISLPSTKINMEKAFKGFGIPSHPSKPFSLFSDPSRSSADVDQSEGDTCPTEFNISGNKSPLDLTLKTSLRLISSASVKWCQRVNPSFAFQNCGCKTSPVLKEEVLSKALCSWIYPQNTLPLSVLYAIGSSTGKPEKEFLEKRRQDWMDSFMSLYSMLRKNICNIFYVYTSEFVALFVGSEMNSKEKKKRSFNAFLSKSTRKLRSLLKKKGVGFSMPLSSKEEEEESEDLEEILEAQRKNLGQAILSDSFSEIDNTSESLLSITGNNNVHALYDFLLNQRFFVSSFNRGDVPSLYSPIPFQNSSLNFSQIRCKEMRRADGLIDQENHNQNGFELSNKNDRKMCYSIEISNSIIPPWVISGICEAMSIDGKNFDSTFTNDSCSEGLNIALKTSFGKSDFSEGENRNNTFGISNSVLVPALHTGTVQRLKYSNGGYVAYTA